MIRLILVLIILAALTLIPHTTSGEGVDTYLTQKAVSGNDTPADQAWYYVSRSGTDSNWYFIDRQGVPPTPTSVSFGTVALAGTGATGLTALTLQNYGESAIDVTIGATDFVGALSTWTLSDTATAGNDTYGLYAGLSGGDYTIIVRKTAPFNTLVSNLAAATNQSWGMELHAPTAMTAYEAMNGNITLTISLH